MDLKPRAVMLAWQELCVAEQQCFGDSLTFHTVEPILRKLLHAHAHRQRADADTATIARLRSALSEALDGQ